MLVVGTQLCLLTKYIVMLLVLLPSIDYCRRYIIYGGRSTHFRIFVGVDNTLPNTKPRCLPQLGGGDERKSGI